MPFALNIFDYDGVLVDSLNEVISAGQDYCRSIGLGCRLNKKIIASLDPMTYDQLARSIDLPSDLIEPFSRFVFKRLQQADAAMPFFPGIKSLLCQLAPPNTAIVSGNSREVIATKLGAHGLDRHIAWIFGAYEPGDKTEKIIKACSHVDADPAHTCMIGDSMSDIRHAKKAGVLSIAVTWGWQSRDVLANEEPDHIVESVDELIALLI